MRPNTPEWDGWRKKGIGASDAVVIMGMSPYKTLHQLWEEKCHPQTFDGKEKGNDFIHQKGHKLERRARALYELDTFQDFPDFLAEYSPWNIARCSMDGYNVEISKGIEIKYVGKEVFEKDGYPVHFLPQIQHQYMVTGAEKIDLVMYNDEIDKIRIVEVKPDVKYIKDMLEKEKEFWEQVETKKEPKLSSKDYKKIVSKSAKALASSYQNLKDNFDNAEKLLEKAKIALLKELPDHPRIICGDLTIQEITKIGNVDYSKIPQLKDVNLEDFRKVSSKYMKIKIKKAKKSKE